MDAEPFIRVGIAALFTLPIGLDRELRGKSAGLRTHVVFGSACAALGYLSLVGVGLSDVADQTRITSGVVSGIGFMGAGVIFASGSRVHGLTTAAALFGAGATGLCVGMGFVALGAALVAVTVVVLAPLEWLNRVLVAPFAFEERTFDVVTRDLAVLRAVQDVVSGHGVRPIEMGVAPFEDAVRATMVVRCRDRLSQRLVQDISATDGVQFVSDRGGLTQS